jgi:hypothetical protein
VASLNLPRHADNPLMAGTDPGHSHAPVFQGDHGHAVTVQGKLPLGSALSVQRLDSPMIGVSLQQMQELHRRYEREVMGVGTYDEYRAALERAAQYEARATAAEKALAEERKLLPGRALQGVLEALKAGTFIKAEVEVLVKALDTMGHFQSEASAVESVLDSLLNHRLVPGERKALRKALEQAERVPASTNEALGRAISRRR